MSTASRLFQQLIITGENMCIFLKLIRLVTQIHVIIIPFMIVICNLILYKIYLSGILDIVNTTYTIYSKVLI